MDIKPGRRNLITVLDWGLGHASRSLALAARLENNGEQVAFASAGNALLMLKNERPDLKHYELPAYNIDYQSSNMIVNMSRQLLKIIRVVWQEKRVLAKIIQEEQYDRIISDSRFGCYARNTPSIMLTHQLQPIFDLPLVGRIYRWFLNKHFTAFWVPDQAGQNRMSGQLSSQSGYTNVSFIGPLSRLKKPETTKVEHYDLLALLSGPEPQRSYLENIITKALMNGKGRYIIVAGQPEKKYESPQLTTSTGGSIERISYSDATQTACLLAGAEKIICRSGYSTLMDFESLEVTGEIILVPTPGQTEQVYLAQVWSALGKATSCAQENLATLLVQNHLSR